MVREFYRLFRLVVIFVALLSWEVGFAQSEPSPRYYHSMAYLPKTGATVLFGGYDGSFRNDTWIWNGRTWSELSLSSRPPPRLKHSMVYSDGCQCLVLFGGAGTQGVLNDTWEFDGTSWIQRSTPVAPSARDSYGLSYDTSRQRVVLFGGFQRGTNLADTWEWDGNFWSQRSPVTSPSARNSHAIVYSPADGRTILFGGYDSTRQSDTWEWDGTNWVLRTTTNTPLARNYHTVVYDSTRARVLLFGGLLSPDTYGNDLWSYQGGVWSLEEAATPLLARASHAAVYDPIQGEMVVIGGSAGSGEQNFLYGTYGLAPGSVGGGTSTVTIRTYTGTPAPTRTPTPLGNASTPASSTGTPAVQSTVLSGTTIPVSTGSATPTVTSTPSSLPLLSPTPTVSSVPTGGTFPPSTSEEITPTPLATIQSGATPNPLPTNGTANGEIPTPFSSATPQSSSEQGEQHTPSAPQTPTQSTIEALLTPVGTGTFSPTPPSQGEHSGITTPTIVTGTSSPGEGTTAGSTPSPTPAVTQNIGGTSTPQSSTTSIPSEKEALSKTPLPSGLTPVPGVTTSLPTHLSTPVDNSRGTTSTPLPESSFDDGTKPVTPLPKGTDSLFPTAVPDSISGKITFQGVGLPQVYLSGGVAGSTMTTADGLFTFPLAPKTKANITFERQGYTFSSPSFENVRASSTPLSIEALSDSIDRSRCTRKEEGKKKLTLENSLATIYRLAAELREKLSRMSPSFLSSKNERLIMVLQRTLTNALRNTTHHPESLFTCKNAHQCKKVSLKSLHNKTAAALKRVSQDVLRLNVILKKKTVAQLGSLFRSKSQKEIRSANRWLSKLGVVTFRCR